MRLILLAALLLLCCPVVSMAKADLVIGVSILPEKYFVERIAGKETKVIVMIGQGFNPVTYEPKPRQVSQLSKASIYYLAGVPFEKKWATVFEKNNPSMMMVSVTKNIKLRLFSSSLGGHSHDEDSISNVDPHYWLNPLLVKIVAKNILDSLITVDPQNSDKYKVNYALFVNELESLDRQIRKKLLKVKKRNFAVFHPSWGYFAEEYGLNQVAVEVQNRQSGAKTLNTTINTIGRLGIKVIFVQKQFSVADASMIARETGARLIQVDPLAENYIENMYHVAELFAEALS